MDLTDPGRDGYSSSVLLRSVAAQVPGFQQSAKCGRYEISRFSSGVEHAGFVLLVLGGVGRIIAIEMQWTEIPWLYAKVIIFGAIILPLEVIYVYHSHLRLPKALTKWEAGERSDDVRD